MLPRTVKPTCPGLKLPPILNCDEYIVIYSSFKEKETGIMCFPHLWDHRLYIHTYIRPHVSYMTFKRPGTMQETSKAGRGGHRVSSISKLFFKVIESYLTQQEWEEYWEH